MLSLQNISSLSNFVIVCVCVAWSGGRAVIQKWSAWLHIGGSAGISYYREFPDRQFSSGSILLNGSSSL